MIEMSGATDPSALSAARIDALIAEMEQWAFAYRNAKSASDQSDAYARWCTALREVGRVRRERAKSIAAAKSAGTTPA
jgi:hypothetical protein